MSSRDAPIPDECLDPVCRLTLPLLTHTLVGRIVATGGVVGMLHRPVKNGVFMIKNNRARSAVLGAAMTAVLAMGIATAAPASAATDAGSKAEAPQYDLSVGGKTTTLGEGETAVYPMLPVKSGASSGNVHTDVVYPGDGTGTLTVTASKGVYHYSIAMHVPATNFVGSFQITDLTSGLSGGRVLELVFAGNVPTSKLRGHRYVGHLEGEADFAGLPVSVVGPNATLYTYK